MALLSTPELLHQPASRGRKAGQHQAIGGWLLIAIGLLLIVVLGWLASWPLVDQLRSANGGLVIDLPVVLLWSLSVPLGGILLIVGAAQVAGVGRAANALIACAAVLSLAWFVWLVAGPSPRAEVPAALFGVAGGLIVVSFIGATWAWAKRRPSLVGRQRVAADLRLCGLAFHLFAAWYLCGLLGAPVFLLRPAVAATSFAGDRVVLLASTVVVCLAIGWVLQCAASLLEQRRSASESV